MFQQESQAIEATIQRYFEGIFYGDVQKLSSAFHPQCMLYGQLQGQLYMKNLEQYLQVVAQRKSPAGSGESFRMKILALDLADGVATARLHTPIAGHTYTDYIALLKTEAGWLIVNKIFSINKHE